MTYGMIVQIRVAGIEDFFVRGESWEWEADQVLAKIIAEVQQSDPRRAHSFVQELEPRKFEDLLRMATRTEVKKEADNECTFILKMPKWTWPIITTVIRAMS
jgi:hypothetical protein